MQWMAQQTSLASWLDAMSRLSGAKFFFNCLIIFFRYFKLVLDYFFDSKNKVMCYRIGPGIIVFAKVI